MKSTLSHPRNYWLVVIVTGILIALTLIFWARSAAFEKASAAEANQSAGPTFTRKGQHFVVAYTPKTQRITVLHTTGSAALLDPSLIKVFGRSVPTGSSPHDLNITWKEGAFQIGEALDRSRTVEIEVADRISKQSETFYFPGVGADEKSAPAEAPRSAPVKVR